MCKHRCLSEFEGHFVIANSTEHLQNCGSLGLFPVYGGQFLSEVVQAWRLTDVRQE